LHVLIAPLSAVLDEPIAAAAGNQPGHSLLSVPTHDKAGEEGKEGKESTDHSALHREVPPCYLVSALAPALLAEEAANASV